MRLSFGPKIFLLQAVLLATMPSGAAIRDTQENPPSTGSDIPRSFTAPTDEYDYIKRDVMIPMRDGVKLHTVIVIPKGATNAPILLTRTPYNASKRAARNNSHTCSRSCRRATRCLSPTATSACFRTCAASTNPRATT